MKDHLDFDLVPCNEECAQVGDSDYYLKTRKEYNTLVNQLRRMFGDFPHGVSCRRASCEHDFGNYHYLRISFDGDDDCQVDFVYYIENHFPEKWDDEAKQEMSQ